MWFRCVWSALNVIASPAGNNIASQIGSHQMITDKQLDHGKGVRGGERRRAWIG